MDLLNTDLSTFYAPATQPPSLSPPQPQHNTHDTLATEEQHVQNLHSSQAVVPPLHFVPQIEHDELCQDVQLAYNAILVGKPILQDSPSTRPLKSSNKRLRKRAGPFIPGVLRGARAHSFFAGNIDTPHRQKKLTVPLHLEVPLSSPSPSAQAQLIVRRQSASPALETRPDIDTALSAEQSQLPAYPSSTASVDMAPGMTRSASYPRSAPAPDPHRGAALIDSRWVPMQRSNSAPLDHKTHARTSNFYRGYNVGAHVRNSVYANHNSLRGTPLEPVPRHLSSSLAHASASLYVNVPPGSTSIRGIGPHGMAQPALLHPSVRRWGGSEVPLHTIATNIDGILKQRHDRDQVKRKAKHQIVDKMRDDGSVRPSVAIQAGKSGLLPLPGVGADDSDADEALVAAPFKSLQSSRLFKPSAQANVKGPHTSKTKTDIGSDESENMAPTITMTRSGRQSRSVTFRHRMPSLVTATGISQDSDSSETEGTATAAHQKARKRVKLLHRAGHERANSTHRSHSNGEAQGPHMASMRPPTAGSALPSASSVADASGKNDLFPRRIFGKGRDNSRPPPRRDGEPECMKRESKARSAAMTVPADLFSPFSSQIATSPHAS